MKNVPARSPAAPQLDDDMSVPEELIGRLHRANDATILHLVEKLTSEERANLAMFCYRKAHFRRIGLAIAATCDLSSLVRQWGTVLGHAVFAQSREGASDPDPIRATHRKVTLARSAGENRPLPADIDHGSKPA
jgi:hypothetical protein